MQRVKHTVKKTDSPETIAAKYGTTAKTIATQAPVGGFKAGQIVDFDIRGIPGGAEQQRGAMRDPGVTAEEVRGESGLLTPRAQALKRAADIMSGLDEGGDLYADPIFGPPTNLGAGGEPVGPLGYDALPEEVDTFQGDIYGREYGREPLGMTEQRRLEARKATEWRSMMKYTTDTLRYVYETGDSSALFSGNVPGKEGAVLWLTDDMIDAYYWAYGEQAIDKIVGMGYYRTPDGVWVPSTVEELGYGMGGYGDFPIGGFGPMEEYKAPLSSYGRRGGAVRTRSERQKLFSGSVPRAHWRI
jgi:hypothetical protein